MLKFDGTSESMLVLALLAGVAGMGCAEPERQLERDDEDATNEAASALSCLPGWWQGCLAVTPIANQQLAISGIDVANSNSALVNPGEYFNAFQVCYKKRGSWQNCEGPGLSDVQGSSPTLAHTPADGDFSWSTPSLYANTQYRVKVRAVVGEEQYFLYDGYHSTQPVSGGSGGGTPPPACDEVECDAACGGGTCTSIGCACY